VVANPRGTQHLCGRHVGNCYARWKVSANTTNLASPRLGGVALLAELEQRGFEYDDGIDGPPRGGRHVSECYPYTTLVGAADFRYEAERPPYKRPPRGVRLSAFRAARAATFDDLGRRVASRTLTLR
jgi:hypothetical protein